MPRKKIKKPGLPNIRDVNIGDVNCKHIMTEEYQHINYLDKHHVERIRFICKVCKKTDGWIIINK